MIRNFACFGFKTTKDDHRLPTCLSLNLLDGHLYCEHKVINGSVGYVVGVV